MSPFEERPSLLLDRLAERADYAVIGPMDGRTPVPDATIRPYAAICHLVADFLRDQRTYVRTGFLIFPNVVLTAAHNLYMLRPGRTGRSVPWGYRVTPGRNGARARPFGSQPAIQLYVPHRFMANSDPLFDFGFIKTARPFQGLPGVFPLAALSNARLRQVRSRPFLHIAGYPCDKSYEPCGSTPSGLIVSRRIPSITASTRARDRTEVRSGFGAIVPVRSTQSASMSAGRRDIARTYVTAALRGPAQPIAACGSRAN